MPKLASIQEALSALQQGRFVIVVDDEDRENEGDLIMSAQQITEEQMALLIRHTSGIIFLAISGEIADHLELPPMVEQNTAKRSTPFTVSIEAKENIDTGVSAKDRVTTVRTAIHPDTKAHDLARPGHIFPLRARDGGVLVRAGHTEASVDLMKMAKLRAGAVGAELMNDNGTMMRMDDLLSFAKLQNIPIITIADLIAERQKKESLIELSAETNLDTETGTWKMMIYTEKKSNKEHVALVYGSPTPNTPTLVRVHSECLTGDTLGSMHCDCGTQLKSAMRKIADEGSGILLYMRDEGRGIGLANKIKAYALQENGFDTVDANTELGFPADLRNYGVGAQILRDLGVQKLRLLTNNPKKIVGLEGFGLEVIERISIEIEPKTAKQKQYLQTKKEKMGHLIS